jgi:hypothetical protein
MSVRYFKVLRLFHLAVDFTGTPAHNATVVTVAKSGEGAGDEPEYVEGTPV